MLATATVAWLTMRHGGGSFSATERGISDAHMRLRLHQLSLHFHVICYLPAFNSFGCSYRILPLLLTLRALAPTNHSIDKAMHRVTRIIAITQVGERYALKLLRLRRNSVLDHCCGLCMESKTFHECTG